MMNYSMPIIADTYKVIGLIGSGGGGVVYLAEHLRLGKNVVLKGDKRALSTKPEALRREVDALKNLSHTYIPQVYDFIEEEGTVYTVMDFIEGESFDKPLKRGERFTQQQVIEWARQLLEAIAYLHSRPPHGILHGDIKPSNVMLTASGEIKLIDFNIALALGEEGAVAVGRSFGYASPEHYMLDDSPGNNSQDDTAYIDTVFSEDSNADVETILESKPQLSYAGSTSGKKTIMLNVRSDIYSLGATLYHIVTGERPAKNAADVKPISTEHFSPALINIISKAMDPVQDLRWQSAGEMLYAFEHLRESDSRSKRYKRRLVLTAAILTLLLLVGGFITFTGLKRMEQLQNAYVLAEYSENALRAGDVSLAINYALRALPEKRGVFTPQNTAEAQKALADALNVYDLSDGFKPYKSLETSSEVIKLASSPNETTVAVMTLGTLSVFDIISGNLLAELSTVDSALADVAFIDEERIVYAGIDGITAFDISTKQTLWTGMAATTISISADKTRIAAVYRDSSIAAIYDVNGKEKGIVSFGDKHLFVTANDRLNDLFYNVFTLNEDGSLLAVSFADGGLEIIKLGNRDQDIIIFEESVYSRFQGGFNEKYFVFSATNSEESLFAAIDTEEAVQTDAFTAPEPVGVQADEKGVYLTFRDKYVKYNPATLEESDPELGQSQKLYRFEYNIDSQHVLISKLGSNAEKEIFEYDAFYDHDEARISDDGKTVMLFGVKGFRLYKINGELIAEVLFEERIYDQQYRRADGLSYLEVVYYDGTVCKYSATDGSLIAEGRIAAPDESLYEEFYTDAVKINAPLHGTPVVYDLKSGKLIRTLEKEAYLTYVTQVGEYLITEYISAIDGSRFGLLLDGRTCETLAKLPNLCDVLSDRLVFDISPGSLRETHIFSIDELIALAKTKEEI